MAQLIAKDESVLIAALKARLVPLEVQSSPVRVEKNQHGLRLAPLAKLSRETLVSLEKAGLEVKRRGSRGDFVEYASWPEAIEAFRIPEPDSPIGPILFRAKRSDFCELAGELLRLGCDRQELCFFVDPNGDDALLLRASEPAYYVVLNALGQNSSVRAFRPVDPRQVIWVELAYAHPLASGLRPPENQLMLVSGKGPWQAVPDGPWQSLYDHADIEYPERHAFQSSLNGPRLKVELRLERSSTPADPTLWVLRKDAMRRVDELVASVPEHVIAALVFARLQSEHAEEPIVVIRASRIAGRAPVLELDGESYSALSDVENLHLPPATRVAPPLRWEKLCEVLAPDPDMLVWTVPIDEQGGFRTEAVSVDAFAPLIDWIDYVVADSESDLQPWLSGMRFEFASFVSIGMEWDEGPPVDQAKSTRRSDQRVKAVDAEREASGDDQQLGGLSSIPSNPALELPEFKLPHAEVEPTEAQAELLELEGRFTTLDGPPNSDERIAIWVELASSYTALRRGREAGLCWTHAVWASKDSGDADVLILRWYDAEVFLLGREPLSRLVDEPTPDDVRSVAAAVVALRARLSNRGDVTNLKAIQSWLAMHDWHLDVRALWLVREALADLGGGDRLALVQAQDLVLRRLKGGLSPDRDVPGFIRVSSGPEKELHAVEFLVEQLDALFAQFQSAHRQRSPIEADPQLTEGYVRLLFAWAFARYGRNEKTRTQMDEARRMHDRNDPVHRFIGEAFEARIEQASKGMPVESPLPRDIALQLERLNSFERYKVDRLRQVSTVLDWTHRLDPFSSFGRPLPDELTSVGASVEELVQAVDALLKSSECDISRAMNLIGLLPEFHAEPKLLQVLDLLESVGSEREVDILEDALIVAGRCELPTLSHALVEKLGKLIRSDSGPAAVAPVLALARSSRVLRRVGQTDRAAELLRGLFSRIQPENSESIFSRLQIAVALSSLGDDSEVEQSITAAMAIALSKNHDLDQYRQIALALSHTSPAQSARGIAELMNGFSTVTDSFNTNSHFCLSVLVFMESMVWGLVGGDLTLSPWARDFIEQDEHQIRRRVFEVLR